jgi:hypothetical protein
MRQLNGTWEPETPMQTEKPQVEEPTRVKVRMPSSGADCPVVVMKRSNVRGAQGAGHSRPDRVWSTGNRRNRRIVAKGGSSSLDDTSRVSREAQARFCEGLGVQFPGATRPSTGDT